MLVENPALLLPSASCFCQSGLTTLILTSEALSSSFIWQKPDVAKTLNAGEEADIFRGMGGVFFSQSSCCSYGKLGNQVGVRSSELSGVLHHLWANLRVRAHAHQDPLDFKSDCSVSRCWRDRWRPDVFAKIQRAFVAFLTGGNQLLRQKENAQVQEINKQIKLVNFDVSKWRSTSVAPVVVSHTLICPSISIKREGFAHLWQPASKLDKSMKS